MVDSRRNPSYVFPVSVQSPLAVTSRVRGIVDDLRGAVGSIAIDTRTGATETWQLRGSILRERYKGLTAIMSAAGAMKVAPYVLLFLLAFLPATILGAGFQGAFNSPDETTRLLAAETFAEHGRLYIDDEITSADPQYSTGPRGFAQHNGRSVPTYSQLPLLVLGIATAIFGGAAPLVLAIIPGMLFVALALMVRRIVPSAPAYVPWAFLGVTPLWYWSSRVYFDVALTFLFVAIGLLILVRAVQLRSERRLFFGIGLLGIAALSRIPEAPFLFMIGFAFVLALAHLGKANRQQQIRLVIVYGAAIFGFFFLPLLLLNWWTNGSPETVSYTLLFEQNFPDRVQPASNIVLEPFRLLWLALFPQPVDFGTLYDTFVYQVLLLSPFLLFLGAIGLVQNAGHASKYFGGYGLGVIAFAFLYMFLSRNDPGTFLAGQTEPDLRVTLVRYWMPLFLLLGTGAALAVAKMPHRYALPLVAAFVITSAYNVWYTEPESVSNLDRTVTVNSERFEQFYDEYTESEALVVAGSSFDKWTVPYRRTIGIWPGTATESNLRHLADTGAAAVRRGQPVYYMFGPNEPGNAVEIVSDQLEPEFLGLTLVAEPAFAGDLWKVTSNPQALELSASTESAQGSSNPAGFGPPGFNFGAPGDASSSTSQFVTTFDAPANRFTVSIENDGSSRNLIANPSFEIGADLWRGPNEQGPVEVITGDAAYGESALRMELLPAPKVGDRVRRTYTLPVDEIESGSWNLRTRVKVDELSSAAVEVLVFVQDENGKNLDKPKARLERVTSEFEEFIVVGGELSKDAAHLAIQISIIADDEGGHGVAIWDGIELIDGPALPHDYCDGDHFGCLWSGDAHGSSSSRSGGVAEILVVSGESEITIDNVVQTGDSIVFENGFIDLVAADGDSHNLGLYGSIPAGTPISLTLTADSTPAVSVLGP